MKKTIIAALSMLTLVSPVASAGTVSVSENSKTFTMTSSVKELSPLHIFEFPHNYSRYIKQAPVADHLDAS